jgi:hypothetical protein
MFASKAEQEEPLPAFEPISFRHAMERPMDTVSRTLFAAAIIFASMAVSPATADVSALGPGRIDPCGLISRDRESVGKLPGNPVVHEHLGDDLAACGRTFTDPLRACKMHVGAADAYTAAASILDGRGEMARDGARVDWMLAFREFSAAAVTCNGDEARGATERQRDALNHFTDVRRIPK